MSKPLEEMTPDELREYADLLDVRNKIKTIPKPLEKIDLNSLINYCEASFEDSIESGMDDEDFMHNVAESALEAIYGKEIFDWINNMHG